MTGQTSPQPYVIFEDFVASERDSVTKHEWLDGVVYAMAGGSIEHGRLATNWSAAVRARLSGRFSVFSSDVMLYVRETNLATYYDRGDKFAHYMRLPSLQAYVLISQHEKRIEVFRRPTGRGHWHREVLGEGETLTLRGENISVREIYE